MATYTELLEQRETLDSLIKEARQRELAAAISEVRSLVTKFELTEQDVFATRRTGSAKAVAKVAPKYRNPQTGDTWTGRGKPPRWIADGDREQFLIKE